MPTKSNSVSRKTIIRANVESDVPAALIGIAKRRGMTQVSMVSRLVNWIARQDPTVQSQVLDDSDPQNRKLLKQLASLAKD